MKLTLNVFEHHSRDAAKRWPDYMFGGRVRTSTLVLISAFFATWWTYNTYRPHPPPPVAPSVVPPGFVPDPNYTWVPRTRVRPQPTYETPTDTPTTTVPEPPPPTTTSPTTTTTPPPLIQLPVLPPPFGPGTTTPAPPPGPVPSTPNPAPAPAPALPFLPGLPR
jgi:hypothetical protein